jgi:serine/threonine-protein kinase
MNAAILDARTPWAEAHECPALDLASALRVAVTTLLGVGRSPTSMTAPNANDLEGVPRVGDVLAGKLRITAVLGIGGMGVVLEGRHLDLDQRVAVKVLKPALAKEPDALTRFVREARAAASIQSRHAVRIFDVGTSEDGLPFIVMERLDGTSIDGLLEARGRLDLPDAVRIVVQASEAIAEANERGIVHRDLKPANLFLADVAGSASGMVKVLDFGISKRMSASEIGHASTSLTAPHTLLGSPQYMSPEQLRTPRDVDARTDVWALGVTLFELLAGKVPFESESIPELCALILTGETPRLSELRSDVPEELDEVLARCLAKSPDGRPASVPDLVLALLPFCPPDVRATAESIAQAAKGTPVDAPRAARERSRRFPRSTSWIALLGGAAAALSISAFVLWGRAERTDPRSVPTPAPMSVAADPASALPTGTSSGEARRPVAQSGSATAAPSAGAPSASTSSDRPVGPTPTRPERGQPPRVRDLRNIKLID